MKEVEFLYRISLQLYESFVDDQIQNRAMNKKILREIDNKRKMKIEKGKMKKMQNVK